MKFLHRPWPGCAVLGLALLLPVAAAAQTAALQGEPALPSGGFSSPVALATLDGQRGGAQAASTDIRLSGTTAGNTAHQMVTGSNDIAAGAFANLSGLPVVIQNSGANVLIQNAVTVNLQMN